MKSTDLYYEEYDDQRTEDFDLVGIDGEEPVPITDLPAQVAELKRLHGSSVVILVFKNRKEPALCV